MQDYWNIAIKMGCEYISVEFIRDLLITKDMPHEDTNVIVSIVDLAATHRKEIAEQYRVHSNIIRNLSDESIQIFRAINMQ